jgi:hypothetical protein
MERSSPRPGRKVRFPDGTTLFALHIDSRTLDDPPPDFGLYMDPLWKPTWNATLIPWEDFDEPRDSSFLFTEIRAAFARAKAGQWVEVGCLAGCGRTGTVLACMAVLAGVPVQDAVTWVRTYYDSCAIETLSQVALVTRFANSL